MLKIGSSNVAKIQVGTDNVSKVILGSSGQIWPAASPVPGDLGQIYTVVESPSQMTFYNVTNTSFALRYIPAGQAIGAYAYWKADLTNISSITANVTTTSYYGLNWPLKFGVTEAVGWTPVYIAGPAQTTQTGVTLDLTVNTSALTGEHYVIMDLDGWTMTLNSITLT